jgi:hypothetical protein
MLILHVRCTLLIVACVLAIVAIFWDADSVECDKDCSCNKDFCSQTGFDEVVSPAHLIQLVNPKALHLVSASDGGIVATADLINLRSKYLTHLASLQIIVATIVRR